MRKQILGPTPNPEDNTPTGALHIPLIATALITSESLAFPVENMFDRQGGPGGSRWQASTPGEQTLILAFDTPQHISKICLEVEETQVSRTQDLCLSASRDGGKTYGEVVRQEYHFSPQGATFQREQWAVNLEHITHLRLVIKPDKGNPAAYATCTTLALY